jgi:hypothetical protein
MFLHISRLKKITAWAATTTDQDYIRMQGMKRVVNDSVHRKELVAGNLKEFFMAGEICLSRPTSTV